MAGTGREDDAPEQLAGKAHRVTGERDAGHAVQVVALRHERLHDDWPRRVRPQGT